MSEEKEVKSFKCKHLTIEQGAGNFECSECYVEKLEQENKELRTRNAEVKAMWRNAEDDNIRQSKVIVELRTRVAELENELRSPIKLSERLCKPYEEEIAELKKRVAELEGKYEKAIDGFNFQLDMRVKSDKKNAELQNRLSETERRRKIEEDAVHRFEKRMDELLKASEGMEKALDMFVGHKWIDWAQDNGYECVGDGWRAWIEKAKQAIADFRAVKEGK